MESLNNSCDQNDTHIDMESMKEYAKNIWEDIHFNCKEDRVLEVFGEWTPANFINQEKAIQKSIYSTDSYDNDFKALEKSIWKNGAEIVQHLWYYIPFIDPELDSGILQGIYEVVDLIKSQDNSNNQYDFTYSLISKGSVLDKKTEFTPDAIREIYERIKTILYDSYKIENNKDVINKAISIWFSWTELMKIINALWYDHINQTVIDSLSSDMTALEMIQKISK